MHGYPVLCARNGDEALDAFEDRDDIGIVFTDINMPGSLDGLDLAREVRSRRPHVGLLVTSGRYREEEVAAAGCSIFIPKPYEPKIVISLIRSMVDDNIHAAMTTASSPSPSTTDADSARAD